MALSTLPTFFVVGAAKCGTTSLHSYLDAHPEISMSRQKEPAVFASERFERELGTYASLLDGDAAVRGESSAVYSQHPRWGGVAERIHSVLPGARFVYLVRDPIDRALSHYGQHLRRGVESRPIDEAFADAARPDSVYVCPSRYAVQIQEYLRWFDPSRILVVDSDDLASRRADTMSRIFGFLEVEPSFTSPAFDSALNTTAQHGIPTRLGRRLKSAGALRVARRTLPRAARTPLSGLIRRPVESVGAGNVLQEELAARLAPEAEWLREFTGQRFAAWSV